jgi:23S rRNA (pseudouridine1915-N3)-methyltransferase
MRVWIAAIGAKPRAGFEELARMYLERIAPYVAGVEAPMFKSEEALWAAVEKERARTAPRVVLLDERGKSMGSEEFARWLGRERDAGRQLVIFAIGPADGWLRKRTADSGQRVEKQSAEVRAQDTGNTMMLSLGPMTMAHELARVVLCEQVYRALTILAGHPYHRGSL